LLRAKHGRRWRGNNSWIHESRRDGAWPVKKASRGLEKEDVPAAPTYKAVGACKSGIFNYLPLLSGVQKLYHCRRASVANGLPFSSFGGPVKKKTKKFSL
jgi:hypothetical protein